MSGRVSKRLGLKRCQLSEGFNGSFQSILQEINLASPNHKDRGVVGFDFFKSYVMAYISDNQSKYDGTFVGIYRQDTSSTGLVDFEASDETLEVEEYTVPKNRAWLDTEVILYVEGNNILACNMGRLDNAIETVVLDTAIKAGVIDDKVGLSISDVPHKPEVERIRRIGVKSINLDVTSFLSAFNNLQKQSPRAKVSDVFTEIFGIPSNNEDTKLRASTCGTLVLAKGKLDAQEVKFDEWLTGVGEKIIDEDMEKYQITLEDGSIVSTSTLKVSKTVSINRHANTFSREHAHALMLNYFAELKNNGSLSW